MAWGSSLHAQTAPTAAEELKRQWDLNRDGTIDAAEADLARGRMRKARNEAMMKAETDPITGKPRGTGQVAGTAAEDDGGLILVPGTGEQPPFAGAAPPEPAAAPPRRERDPLPGTRAPTTTATIPSTAPPNTAPGGVRGGAGLQQQMPPGGRDSRASELSSRARILPNGAPTPPQASGRPPTTVAPQQPWGPQRPGIISGGARPTGPAIRSSSIPQSQNLNAGRLPGGLPQTRGAAPGSGLPGTSTLPRPPIQPFGAAGSAPVGGGQIRGGYPPTGPLPPGMPGVGRGSAQPPTSAQPFRSGARAPATQPSAARPPQAAVPAVPRPPRLGPQDFYGR